MAKPTAPAEPEAQGERAAVDEVRDLVDGQVETQAKLATAEAELAELRAKLQEALEKCAGAAGFAIEASALTLDNVVSAIEHAVEKRDEWASEAEDLIKEQKAKLQESEARVLQLDSALNALTAKHESQIRTAVEDVAYMNNKLQAAEAELPHLREAAELLRSTIAGASGPIGPVWADWLARDQKRGSATTEETAPGRDWTLEDFATAFDGDVRAIVARVAREAIQAGGGNVHHSAVRALELLAEAAESKRGER